MTVGLSAVNLANAWLNVLSGTNITAPTNTYVQLHTGDPGASGTANVSSVTTRPVLAWNAASAGSKTISNTPSWATWAGTNGEVVTHISLWGASSAGTFYDAITLTASKTVNTGDTLNLTSLSIALTPIAA